MPLIKEQDWQTLPTQQEVYDFFLFIKQRYGKQTDQDKSKTITFSNHSANTIEEWRDDKEDGVWK